MSQKKISKDPGKFRFVFSLGRLHVGIGRRPQSFTDWLVEQGIEPEYELHRFVPQVQVYPYGEPLPASFYGPPKSAETAVCLQVPRRLLDQFQVIDAERAHVTTSHTPDPHAYPSLKRLDPFSDVPHPSFDPAKCEAKFGADPMLA